MHLADEEITITFNDERIHLRPSLRAAARLERRHDGFPAIMRAVGECSVTVIADLIKECATAPTKAPALLVVPGIAWRLAPLVPALQVLVLNLMGIDLDAEDSAEDHSEADPGITYAEAHAELFKIATGWLGWTPADAWSASPAEIKLAFKGRLELLRAEFGGEEPTGKPKAPATLDDKFTALMGHLATLPGAKTA